MIVELEGKQIITVTEANSSDSEEVSSMAN